MDITQCDGCVETGDKDGQLLWGHQGLFLPGVHLGLRQVLGSITEWPLLNEREWMLADRSWPLDMRVHDANASGTRAIGA